MLQLSCDIEVNFSGICMNVVTVEEEQLDPWPPVSGERQLLPGFAPEWIIARMWTVYYPNPRAI
jgi:hypothetical protein